MYVYVPFKMDFSHIPPARVFRIFQQHDKNQKGCLTLIQAKNAVTQLSQEDPTSPPLPQVLLEFDKTVLMPVGLVEFFKCLHFHELVAQWELLFRKVDRRHSGVLTSTDFLAFFQYSKLEDPQGEVDTFFDTVGKRQKVDSFNFDEFVALLAFASPLVLKSEHLSEAKIREVKSLYRCYDPEGREFIANDQVQRLLKDLALERDLELVHNWLEANNSPGVTLAKFLELVGYNAEVQLYRTAFKNADLNHSGLVEEGELALLLERLGVNSPAREAHAVLKTNQKVGSGLDFDQFVDFMLETEHTKEN